MQTADQMAAVDLSDAGDGGGLTLMDALQQHFVFRYGFQRGYEFFHKLPHLDVFGKFLPT